MSCFLPFPGWQKLAAFITSAYALVYAVGPLAFAALRRHEPDRDRPYRLPAGQVLAPLAFIAANFVVYFAGWKTDQKVFLAVVAGFVILAVHYMQGSERRPHSTGARPCGCGLTSEGSRFFPIWDLSTGPTSSDSLSTS